MAPRSSDLDLGAAGVRPDPGLGLVQPYHMLDDMLDHMQGLATSRCGRRRPGSRLWRISGRATDLAVTHAQFVHDVLPYGGGNAHPGFMGWVQGAGTPVGMLAEMLAAGLNANLGGRDHMPIEVERQVLAWTAEMFDFPADASGLFVTGASQANFLAVLIARTRALGPAVRKSGLGASGLTAYASQAVHGWSPAPWTWRAWAERLRLVPRGRRPPHRPCGPEPPSPPTGRRAAPFLLIGSAGRWTGPS